MSLHNSWSLSRSPPSSSSSLPRTSPKPPSPTHPSHHLCLVQQNKLRCNTPLWSSTTEAGHQTSGLNDPSMITQHNKQHSLIAHTSLRLETLVTIMTDKCKTHSYKIVMKCADHDESNRLVQPSTVKGHEHSRSARIDSPWRKWDLTEERDGAVAGHSRCGRADDANWSTRHFARIRMSVSCAREKDDESDSNWHGSATELHRGMNSSLAQRQHIKSSLLPSLFRKITMKGLMMQVFWAKKYIHVWFIWISAISMVTMHCVQ